MIPSSGFTKRLVLWSCVVALTAAYATPGAGQTFEELKGKRKFKGRSFAELASSGGIAMVFGRDMPISSPGESKRGGHDHGRGGNTFVNDPCIDPHWSAPFPINFFRTVQSETEIAVLNVPGSMGKKMVAGYNDSYGFDDTRQGLSGYAYSTNGGNTWIDGGGLPPRIAPPQQGVPAGTPGFDAYFGDPVIVVHHQSQTFYYASLYQRPDGFSTLSVNRGSFTSAPPHVVESVSNTRCANDPTEHGIPDPPSNQKERITWEPPVEAVPVAAAPDPRRDDFLDKEWLYVDQNTGTLYMTYTRFGFDGSTPIEMVRCIGCANKPSPLTSADWSPPSVIVPNEALEFNQATQPFTTPTGRVIVTWFAREFGAPPTFPEIAQRIEYAVSDDDGATFSTERLVAVVRPQGEPPGYNRARLTILNAPYIFVDRGADDGVFTSQEQARRGFGNVYITYFDGVTELPQPPPNCPPPPAPPNPACFPNPAQGSVNPFARAARILLSTSDDNGDTFNPPVQVNDDATLTTHVFPSVQANKNGDVYVAWIDRRQDPNPFIPATPTTPRGGGNIFNDLYAAVSKDFGASFGHNKVQTTVSTSWFTRADAAPNYGDYNSSELLGFNQFVSIWADGRFPTGSFQDIRPPATTGPARPAGTPDAIFTIAQGLGVGNDPNPDR